MAVQNFNFNDAPDYSLNSGLIKEMIDMYGVNVKFIVTKKMNKDTVVFGDWSHMMSDPTRIYEMFVLPEESSDWVQGDYSFSEFGFLNFETVDVFVHRENLENIPDIDTLAISHLMVFPNGKVMEVTNQELTEPGVNNLFTYRNAKSAFKLSLKPYEFKLIEELNNTDISTEKDVNGNIIPNDTLDKYFDELTDVYNEQEQELEVKPLVDKVTDDPNTENDIYKKSSIIDDSEKAPWEKED